MAGNGRTIAVLVLVALALAACSLPFGGGSDRPAPASVPPEAQPAVDAAIDAAAADLGVDPGSVTVVSVEAKDWPDMSLGCPEPGMMYGQMITPGYVVELEVSGTTHAYHTDAGGQQAVTCTS
jgi:hypothetical protein